MISRYVASLLLVGICALGVSCRHTDTEAVPEPAALQTRQQLDQVSQLVKDGKLDEASTLLQTVGMDHYADENLQLDELIRQRRQEDAKSLPAKLSAETAVRQVQDRLRLPDNYGKVVTKEETPLELPPTPMESLLNKNVSMNMKNAPVGTIIEKLSEIDGLNIIADQALTVKDAASGGDKPNGSNPAALTILVKDVPLKEVLSYISRNMGLTFSLSENIVWVSKADEAEGIRGPQLETRIYPLRHGLLPGSADGAGGGGDTLAAATKGPSSRGAWSGNAASVASALADGDGAEDDKELMEALDAFLVDGPAGTTFRLYPDRNLLVVRTGREMQRQVEQLVKGFDIERQQVLIEARFLTIGTKELKDLGSSLQKLAYTNGTTTLKNIPSYDADGKPTQPRQIYDAGLQSGIFANSMSPALGTPGSNNQVNLGGVLGNVEYSYLIRALEEQTSTKTLSAPRVTVVNNRVAHIHKGENLYYWEEWETDVSYTPNGNNNNSTQTALPRPSGTPTEVKLGLTLDVKVNIGNNGQTVMLALNPSITALKGFYTYGTGQDPKETATKPVAGQQTTGYQLPVIADNSVSTWAVVKSGETVVLGGVLEDIDQEKVEKTPILGDIPVLGWLFKHKSKSKEPQQLLIFVTATVVLPTGEFVEFKPAAPPGK